MRIERILGPLLATVVVALSLPALAERRVALVIGNGAYQGVPQLANPPNDARDVATALKSLGFKVTLGVDLDKERMKRMIEEFASQADGDASSCTMRGTGSNLGDITT